MKRLLAFVAVVTSAVGLYAVTAPAGQQAVTPGQIAALNKKVTALQKDLKQVKGALAGLETCVAVKALAINEYGSDTFGFVYKQPSGTQITTTALATTDTGDTPQFWILTTTPACATVINARTVPRPRLGSH